MHDFTRHTTRSSGRPLMAILAFLFIAAFPGMPAPAQETDRADDAIVLFNKAQDAHEKGELAAAIELYEQALKLIPEFPEAQAQKGAAFISLGRLDEAETAYRRAVELRPDWSLAVAGLGDVLVQRQKFAAAEPVLKKAIELDKMNFPAYAALVELRLKTGANREGLKELLSAVDALVSNARPTASIWAARAALENELGDRAETKKSLAAALRIDPNNRLALSQSIDLAIEESDATGARGYFGRLEGVSGKTTSLDAYRAKVLLVEGKTDEAEKVLTGIKDPDVEAARLLEAIKLSKSTDAAVLEKELAGDPKNVTILGRLCSVYRLNDPAAALAYCRQAIELDPANVGFAVGYGAALLQTKKYSDAVDVLSKLKTAAPENATVRANLATALFQSKRYAEAKAEYRWLAEKQPKLAATYYFLAIVHDQLGEYMDAMANYQQFLRLAEAESNKLEIEKVNLRLPGLQKQIKDGRGKKND
jgi:tetratricopeptide (TPR) repeat protein